jgi:hypothetical protein
MKEIHSTHLIALHVELIGSMTTTRDVHNVKMDFGKSKLS